MISLIPKKKQWQRWSLPSKLTAIGTLVGLLGFLLTILTTFSNRVGQGEKPEGFEGIWDEAKAFNIAWPTPRDLKSIDGHGDKFERSFFMSLQGRDVRLVLTSTSEGECQACQLVLSLFLFKKTDDRWVLEDESRDFRRAGRETFNDISEIIDVWHIGPDRFGIAFQTTSWHQGDTFIGIELYAFIANELTVVLRGFVKEFFSGVEKEEAIEMGFWHESGIRLTVDRSNSSFGFFDLSAQYFSTDTQATLDETFKFDGSSYPLLDLSSVEKCRGGLVGFIENKKCMP